MFFPNKEAAGLRLTVWKKKQTRKDDQGATVPYVLKDAINEV